MTGKSITLFVAAALAEVGGAYLVWIGLREGKGALGVIARERRDRRLTIAAPTNDLRPEASVSSGSTTGTSLYCYLFGPIPAGVEGTDYRRANRQSAGERTGLTASQKRWQRRRRAT